MTRGRIAFTSSLLAVLAGAALLVVAFTVSLYAPSGTLVEENGIGVLVPVSIPLVLTLVAFAGLWACCARGSVLGERAAITVLTLLGLFTLLSGFSIGILVLPVTALVAIAVATTPRPRGR